MSVEHDHEAEVYERCLPHMNVGTLGHSNHGKTTLTAAIKNYLVKWLGGVEISADGKPSLFEYSTLNRHYAHRNVPGLPKYTKLVYSAASTLDVGILVVSSKDGIEAQTREHVIIARQANIPHMVVFINMYDDDMDAKALDQLERQLRALLTKYGYAADQCPIIKGSAKKALEGDKTSMFELTNHLDSVPMPQRELDRPFFMPITEVIYVRGVGIVARGKIQAGRLCDGQQVDLLGLRKDKESIQCKSVHVFGKAVPSFVQAGDCVSVLLTQNGKELNRKNVKRGMVLCQMGTRHVHTKFTVKVDVLSTKEGGRTKEFTAKYKPVIYGYTWSCTASRIELPAGVKKVHPGDKDVSLTITLRIPTVVDEGAKMCIRDDKLTVATGVVTGILE